MDSQEELNAKSLIPALLVSFTLIISIGIAVSYARSRTSTIVLPGGITYLGPSPSATPANGTRFSNVLDGQIPIPDNATWAEQKGKVFPYTFTYPTTISLGVFPNDPYDSVTVFYNGTNAQGNLFLRVEDLNMLNKKAYIATSKESYAKDWWKDYSWTGVSSVTAFTNSQGLHGYRAKYIDAKGQTPYEHVFFEVPGKDNLVIWISGKLFSQTIFDRLVDSVNWSK